MSSFFSVLVVNTQGVLLLLLLVICAGAILQWLTWIFGWGRFKERTPAGGGKAALRFVFADLLVKIIDDFRHLLALVVVVIFALALTYALVLVAYEPTGRLDAYEQSSAGRCVLAWRPGWCDHWLLLRREGR